MVLYTLILGTAVFLPFFTWAYDPMEISKEAETKVVDLSVSDADRAREIPIRVFLGEHSFATILFSHGLGGNREGSAYLGQHWSKRGYSVIYVQHPGSDSSVWKDVETKDRLNKMRNAASLKNLRLRIGDVISVLDALELWNEDKKHSLNKKMNLTEIGMSGHSFGAMTTQALSGQVFSITGARFTDKRIDAAIAFSPSSPSFGSASKAFGSVTLPWLLMTGTKDVSPIGNQTVESRRDVYLHLPPGMKYELVLSGAEHSAFTDRQLSSEVGQRNPNHHRAILALSTAFWDAYLKKDSKAREWLDSEEVKKFLEEGDLWQRK